MSRWYKNDGTSIETVIGKNGNLRDVTVKDAREMKLVPSVTTVLHILDKPSLSHWKIRNVLEAALTLPKNEGESLDDFLERSIADADTISNNAAKFGTNIHKMINSYMKLNMYSPIDKRTEDIMQPMVEWILAHEMKGESELFMINDKCAGTCDFIGVMLLDGEYRDVIIDFKTQGTKKDQPCKYYPDHLYQLGGYLYLTGAAKHTLVNVIVSTTEPKRIEHKVWPELDIEHGLVSFKAILNAFRTIKKLL